MRFDRSITSLATWPSWPVRFLASSLALVGGIALSAILSFNGHWSLVFNLFLSIAALRLSGVVFVARAKDTSPIPAKRDGIIKAIDQADDWLMGIDPKLAQGIERKRIDAAAELNSRVEASPPDVPALFGRMSDCSRYGCCGGRVDRIIPRAFTFDL